jgi:hypothetical protein
MNNDKKQIIDIDELVLIGGPHARSIEAELRRVMRGSGALEKAVAADTETAVVREIARFVGHAVRGGGT